MKKEQLIVIVVILAVAVGVAFFGRKDSTPTDGNARIVAALTAREIPVVVVTNGRGGADGDFLNAAKAAVAGVEKVRLIHIDKQSPLERESGNEVPKDKLPALAVLGLDGAPVLMASTNVDAAALKKAVETGLTKKPIEIPTHEHTDSCGHAH